MKSLDHPIDSSLIPVIFADGKKIYNSLAKTYVKHSNGLFILAPSGSGKTYYVKSQEDMDWIDGDLLWVITGADYSNDEWDNEIEDIMEINARCDIITHQAKKQGFWIIGSSNLFLQPDAIVIPDWETHIKYIKNRQDAQYDGGATTSDIEGLKDHINWISKTWKNKVPFFNSIEKAVEFLSKNNANLL